MINQHIAILIIKRMQNIELVDSSEFKDKKKYYQFLIKKYCNRTLLKYVLMVCLWLAAGRVKLEII